MMQTYEDLMSIYSKYRKEDYGRLMGNLLRELADNFESGIIELHEIHVTTPGPKYVDSRYWDKPIVHSNEPKSLTISYFVRGEKDHA